MKKVLILLFLVFLTSCGSKYEKGLVEYKKNDVEKALTACEGDDGYGCRFIRGMAHIYGRGYERDIRKGIKLLKESSDNGIVQAQSELGVFYLNGYGVPKNFSLGLKLIKTAARKEDPLAFHNLGILYKSGRVVEKDLDLSIKYSIKAFEGGKAGGALIAGKTFYEKKDYDSSVLWFKKGSEKGSVECDYTLGLFYEEARHRDLQKAYKWYKSAAEKGHLDSIHKVGLFNYYGFGRYANKDEGLKWFLIAAKKNHAISQYTVGFIYHSNRYKKYDKSLYWYKKAAQNGNIPAITQIGIHFLNGAGVKKDEKKAFEIFNEAIKKGDIRASFIMGRLYELGLGTEKSMKKALERYEYAADKGYDEAVKKLVQINIKDKNCEKAIERYLKSSKYNLRYITEAGLLLYFEKKCLNKKRAVTFVKDAAEKGDSKAQEFLAAFYVDGFVIKKDLVEACAWVNIALSTTRTKSGIALRNKIEKKISLNDLRKAQRRTQEIIRKYGLIN